MEEPVVARGDLTDPAVVRLLEAHVVELRTISPPDSTHALDLDGLRAPGVRLWAARVGATVVGCVALRDHDADLTELKSMRTGPGWTGQGIGALLLESALAAARASGHRRVSLETGTGEFFSSAHRLYARYGFVDCEPFASYRPDPESRFMTLRL